MADRPIIERPGNDEPEGGMSFCDRHWAALKAALDERGLMGFVPDTGEQAMKQVVETYQREREGKGPTVDSFDPLMAAFFAISGNVMDVLTGAGANPLYLLSTGPEDPVEGYGEEYEGRTWPRCPLCYLNLAHEVSCEGCHLPKVNGYDGWIERAADDQAEAAEKLGDD